MKQLDIFDYLEPTTKEPVYEVGNKVRIKTAKELDNPAVETVAYLTDYKFGGKEGVIKDIHIGKSISYYVDTKIGRAVVSEEELVFIG